MYLYVKTHKTGLKYLGKTDNDPFKYKGSGTYWLRHLKKYGDEHSTEILLETDDKELFREKALYYSNLFNVVESKEWANIVPEQGDGGDTSMSPKYQKYLKNKNFLFGKKNAMYGKSVTDFMTDAEITKWKTNIGKAKKGRKQTAEHIEKRKRFGKDNCRYGKAPWNKGKIGVQSKSLESKKKVSVPIVFRGVEYYSIREAARQNNLSEFLVKKEVFGNGFAKARQIVNRDK